jgi:hypothetical protein
MDIPRFHSATAAPDALRQRWRRHVTVHAKRLVLF